MFSLQLPTGRGLVEQAVPTEGSLGVTLQDEDRPRQGHPGMSAEGGERGWDLEGRIEAPAPIFSGPDNRLDCDTRGQRGREEGSRRHTPLQERVRGGAVLLGSGSGRLLIVPSNRLQKGSPWARQGRDKQRLQTCAREEGSSPGPRAPWPCWHLPYTSSSLSWHPGLPLLAPSPGSMFG